MVAVDKYTFRITWSEEDREHVGLCAEFPSLSWLAPSQEKALRGIMKVVADALSDLKATGEEIPEPLSTKQYSGQLRVRLPENLHRKLAIEAAEEQTSLNRIIINKLSG